MTNQTGSQSHKLTAGIKAAGCAAKISPAELDQIVRSLSSRPCPSLLTGIDNFEDAAVYKIADDLAIVQTVDFFPPVVDDPFLFGRIAAVNALSDVYAMGGRPVLALNVFCFPTCDYPLAVAAEILKGGADAVAEAGAVLAGGHSIQGPEPLYGLAVTGFVHPDRILTNGGARDGDLLVLCKPIGTGVALLGYKGAVLSEPARKALLDNLTSLNARALAVALHRTIHAATDVTGFGLVGHLHEMASASNLAILLRSHAVPLLPEAHSLAEQGFVPAGAYANRKAYETWVSFKEEVDTALADLLFDPQTAGGLLFATVPSEAGALLEDLRRSGIQASIIGEFKQGKPGLVEVTAHDK
jgi:selenide,water dikinase